MTREALLARRNKVNGVRKDPIDTRDYLAKTRGPVGAVPVSADLRQYAREIENQGRLNSCVGNAVSSEMELIDEVAHVGSGQDFSRLFVYWNARKLSGLENEDGGAYIRDGMKACNKHGICNEADWTYTESEVNTQPSEAAYEAARKHRVIRYERIQVTDRNTLKEFIANENKSITIGMGLGEDFYNISGSLDTQDYNKISADNEQIGGHAMNMVGYDDNLNGGSFIVENSWGTSWGDNGYFALKYSVWEVDGWDAWVCTELKTNMDPSDPDYVPGDDPNPPNPNPDPNPNPIPDPTPPGPVPPHDIDKNISPTELIDTMDAFFNGPVGAKPSRTGVIQNTTRAPERKRRR